MERTWEGTPGWEHSWELRLSSMGVQSTSGEQTMLPVKSEKENEAPCIFKQLTKTMTALSQ